MEAFHFIEFNVVIDYLLTYIIIFFIVLISIIIDAFHLEKIYIFLKKYL
jgi:hypothetical protein